jgi:hypothetical protein
MPFLEKKIMNAPVFNSRNCVMDSTMKNIRVFYREDLRSVLMVLVRYVYTANEDERFLGSSIQFLSPNVSFFIGGLGIYEVAYSPLLKRPQFEKTAFFFITNVSFLTGEAVYGYGVR